VRECSQHRPGAGEIDEGDGGQIEGSAVLGGTVAMVDPGDGAPDATSGDSPESLGPGGSALDRLNPPDSIGYGLAELCRVY
jgi:hypothetical protein